MGNRTHHLLVLRVTLQPTEPELQVILDQTSVELFWLCTGPACPRPVSLPPESPHLPLTPGARPLHLAPGVPQPHQLHLLTLERGLGQKEKKLSRSGAFLERQLRFCPEGWGGEGREPHRGAVLLVLVQGTGMAG